SLYHFDTPQAGEAFRHSAKAIEMADGGWLRKSSYPRSKEWRRAIVSLSAIELVPFQVGRDHQRSRSEAGVWTGAASATSEAVAIWSAITRPESASIAWLTSVAGSVSKEPRRVRISRTV